MNVHVIRVVTEQVTFTRSRLPMAKHVRPRGRTDAITAVVCPSQENHAKLASITAQQSLVSSRLTGERIVPPPVSGRFLPFAA